MSDEKIIRIPTDYHDPVIKNRSGRMILNYNIEGKDPIEFEGSITVSEGCMLVIQAMKFFQEKMD